MTDPTDIETKAHTLPPVITRPLPVVILQAITLQVPIQNLLVIMGRVEMMNLTCHQHLIQEVVLYQVNQASRLQGYPLPRSGRQNVPATTT